MIRLALLAFVIAGCSRPMDEKSFLRWLADPDNGLVKSRKVNGVIIETKFLPPEYLAMNDMKNDPSLSDERYAEVFQAYNEGLAFMITIKPESGGHSVMFNNVTTIEEFRERVYDLNFSFAEKVTMNSAVGIFEPVLSVMENTYGLQDHKIFYVLFANTDSQKCLADADHVDITFNDDVFATGVTHFRFSKGDMELASALLSSQR